MNEMENQKVKSDKDHEREIAKRLSTQFLKLADAVDTSLDIAKECVLTAFSLHPTRACYDRIRDIAVACGKVNGNAGPSEVFSDRLSGPIGENPSKPDDRCMDTDHDGRDKLLKSLLSSPMKKEQPSTCPLHPKSSSTTQGPVGTLCFNCGDFTGIDTSKKSVEPPEPKVAPLDTWSHSTADSTIHLPGQVLDGVKLGLTRQLCDDLQVVLNSPRYHNLNWSLDWSELNALCDTYLHHAEEMRNTNKELKFLNIDYNQFKDWPSDEDNGIGAYGIEKGYEPWIAAVPSDSSERSVPYQPPANYKRGTAARRNADDSSDSDSGSLRQMRRTARQRKLHRLESSESDYESGECKPKHFRVSPLVSDTEDTNTQDSQTDSLGSDGCRQDKKTNKSCNKDMTKKRGKSKHYRMLVNENIRRPTDDVSGSDVSNDIITLFSADMDENKRETIKASAYPAAAQLRILTEKRSDPAVLKSLRMFRPQNAKVIQNNILNNKTKDNVTNNNANSVAKFAPMLSTLNLNPKIVLTRADEIDRKVLQSKKLTLSAGDLSTELINIQKKLTFSQHKNSLNPYHKRKNDATEKNENRKNRKSINSNLGSDYGILAKAARDSDINRLAKNVPGLNSLEMMVPPRVQSTVNVVQLSRNIPQSPNSGSINSGNTPPRNRTTSIAGSIQLPGTPSSGGHDSGVGMSPAGQTPPPRSSVLHDVGDEANQPPDTSSPGSTNPSTEPDSPRTNQRISQNDSPNKSPSPSASATVPIASEQIQLVYKQDGMYQLAVNPSATHQRSVLTLQNLEETATVRHLQRLPESTRTTYERSPVKVQPTGQNTGLPKFQHAFGKTIYTLSTDPTTTAASTTTDTITQPLQKTSTNLSKAVQTSVPSAQANINVQSITNIPNLQLSSGRPILNIVQSANASVTNPTASQITQLVQNTSPGVIYAQKIPTNVTISTTNPGQLNLIPTIAHTNSLPGGRAGVVKLNIIRTPLRQQNIAIQAALTGPRIQTAQRATAPQPQQTVRADSLLNEVANPVSSTTLEQLREFESVLEQVKERSTIQPQQQNSTTTTTVQTQTTTTQQTVTKHDQQSVSALAQRLITTQSSSPEFSSNGNAVTFQQDVFPQKVSLASLTQSNPTTPQKMTNSTPVVVFTSYCQPAASPALSVTSQSSSSPCVTPAPSSVPSSGKTPPTPSPKSGKKAVPKTVKTSATNTSKASPIPKPQQKPQEDEQTAQRIYTILAEYAEQLRNSPDLNNKPAPRRRSNPPTNPSQSSKRKKSSKSKASGQQSSEMSPSTDDLGRTMGSEDSSSGIVQVQDSPGGFNQDEPATPAASIDSAPESTRNMTDSNDGVEVNVKRRNLFFTESGGQPRAVIVQETVPSASVSVSEALASVTGKVAGTTAVFVSGTNYVLPMNLMKGTQQFHIVSSGSSKLLTVPGVRTSGTTGVNNTLVLQSFLNQASKLISQPGMKQVKIPTLQTLTTSQGLNSSQNTSVVVQTGTSSCNDTGDITIKSEAPEMKSEPTTPVNEPSILVNKSPTIGLIQRNLSDIGEGQQICGVITSNPNLTLQGTRLFNSSIAKLSTGLKTESVVCLTQDKKVQDSGDKSGQNNLAHGTIALAFAQSQVPVNSNQSQVSLKETKEVSTEMTTGDKMISPKSVKRKLDDMDMDDKALSITSHSIASGITNTLQSSIKIEPALMTTAPKMEDQGEYSVADPGRSEDQSMRQGNPADAMETTIKVENGVLCGNARLQEAWDPERKSSPETPWRYVPTGNQLTIEPLKVYSRDGENSESVLQIINKGQGIEMASGQVFQTNTKKYFLNHTLEPFQYPSKGAIVKSQPNPRNDREMQRLDRTRAAMEREVRLHKSLSEECEDLGVDEPSTSDLFPEADLFFDTNHSPSFDHSSQDASCSQPLGVKFNATYFRPLDSSSASRDASPDEVRVNERRRTPGPRARAVRESSKRVKRDKPEGLESPPKHMRLSPENLSQDGSSTSDVSRMSLGNVTSMENDGNQSKISRNGSKEGSPTVSMSLPHMKLDMKLDMDLDESLPPSANNAASSEEETGESMTLMSSNTADVIVPSPLSPVAGPLLSTHKYTYSNKKRGKTKVLTAEYLSWGSPISERTRSSSDEDVDEDSSISESISSQNDDVITNGMDDNMQAKGACNYLKKKDKLRVVLNRADAKAIIAKRNKEAMNESVVTSDKTSEASDDETCHATMIEPDCRARRSSLRGHVKKGCACCNGSPERPKKKSVKVDHKLKKKLMSKQIGKRR